MKSNCWRYAHEMVNEHDGEMWVCYRISPYSHWHGRIPAWMQRAARWLVYEWYVVFAYLCIPAYGGWMHCVVRFDMPRGYSHFKASECKTKHWLPPTHYEGRTKHQ